MWAAKKHLLVDSVKLRDYCKAKDSEMVGIRYAGKTLLGCYTSNSNLAPRLIAQCKQYKFDHPLEDVSYFGDFNVHNTNWISSTHTDQGGEDAFDMCEMFGLSQLVSFPSRDDTVNTLDLIMTTMAGDAYALSNLGTGDHVSILTTLKLTDAIPHSPKRSSVYLWNKAP